MISQSEVYVFEADKMIQGFVGLNDEYIEGIFVSDEMQSCGIGKILLDYIKDKKGDRLLRETGRLLRSGAIWGNKTHHEKEVRKCELRYAEFEPQIRRMQADIFLVKPVTEYQLREAVSKLLQKTTRRNEQCKEDEQNDVEMETAGRIFTGGGNDFYDAGHSGICDGNRYIRRP